MKSSFLLSVALCALVSANAFGQIKKKAVTPVKKQTTQVKKAAPVAKPQQVTTTAPVSGTSLAATLEKSAFDKFYERLSINHFSVITSPDLDDWDSRHAAISPEYSGGTNEDTYPLNIWNQVNFGYNFGAKMKFNFIPRYTIFLDEAPGQDPGDRGMIQIEDALVGFSGVVYSSGDKKFNWWMRPALRLPTSRGSRNYNHAAFGRITYQPEWIQTFSYDFNPNFQLSLTHIHRFWVFENRYNNSRHRILTIPGLTYKFSDKSNLQIYYENFIENNKRYKSINGLEPHYTDVWQNLMVGIGHDVTDKLNVLPFIAAYVNDVPFSTESMWLGAWVSYQIK